MVSPWTGLLADAIEEPTDLLCLQQQAGLAAHWLADFCFRQQLLPLLAVEHPPLQQQDDSPDAELKQYLLIEPLGHRQSKCGVLASNVAGAVANTIRIPANFRIRRMIHRLNYDCQRGLRQVHRRFLAMRRQLARRMGNAEP
jgi:hypothetical protein